MSGGFVPVRRGIEDHCINGSIGATELGVYTIMLVQADYRTGVWTGSAPRLLATLPRGGELRHMQRAIERLEAIGFIRVFHRHGARGNYRVLIDKFEPTAGALKGKRLNAAESESWEQPHYDPCAVLDAVTAGEPDGVAAPYQEQRGKGRYKKKQKDSVFVAKDAASSPLETIREIVASLPETCRRDPRSFHFAINRSLKSLGWKVRREWPVADRGDGQPGRIDLVVTSPHAIAIELDRKTPREKSLLKLARFAGFRFVVLREQKGPQAVLDVTEQAGEHRQKRRINGMGAARPTQVPGRIEACSEQQAALAELRRIAGIKSMPRPMTDAEFDARRALIEEQARRIRLAQPGPVNPLPTKTAKELIHEMGNRAQGEAVRKVSA